MDNCIFCKILAGKAPANVVYEDEVCIVFMDIQPVTPGHMLVVPRQHFVGLSDLKEEIGGHLFRVGQRMATALKQSKIPCEGVNLFLADGEVAFQTVFHVHLHVIPRTSGDGFRLIFGPQYKNLPERERLEQIANQIKLAL
ncbi:MAG TPA: HIT family protein [Anaerolineaceae bacterium]|nr:HIT family protein [Anaerolineaceae bacterium]